MTDESGAFRSLILSHEHRGILERALSAAALNEPDEQDRRLYVDLWRAGLLRRNGEVGFQLSRLGRESLSRTN